MDAVKYVASRYHTTPERVLKHYMIQTGVLAADSASDDNYNLAPNEIALFGDLGIRPSVMEIL